MSVENAIPPLATRTGVPDVSVIVTVYDTMPYLTACLDSLAAQTIGLHRMEIIAVDDGSTDGSGAELDRFAALHPGAVTVVHQANSGGPAGPSNRALDLAGGRFVQFLGGDDHLAPQALERLVRAADAWDSDVVAGKLAGVNGRRVHEALFTETRRDVPLFDSPLPWSLSNCKLFRRELVERHGLRFREDLAAFSDQPFTLEALLRARRVSVLADHTYYYAVRRADAGNITYRADHLTRLDCTEKIIRFVARMVGAGPERDAILRRHFGHEVARLLRADFTGLDRAVQDQVCAGVARLAGRYLTPGVMDALPVRSRLRISLARHGAVDLLCEAIRRDLAGARPPVFVDGDRVLSQDPGFGDDRLGLPDACFQVGGGLSRRIREGLRTSRVRWEQDGEGPVLAFDLWAPLSGAFGARIRLVPSHRSAGSDVPAQAVRQDAEAGTVFHVRVPVRPEGAGVLRWTVRFHADIAGETYESPVPMTGPAALLHKWRQGLPLRMAASANRRGRLAIAVTPIRPGRVVRRLRHMIVPSAGSPS